ncbi:hypothetical protein [Streptomyces sp. NPDC000878]
MLEAFAIVAAELSNAWLVPAGADHPDWCDYSIAVGRPVVSTN